LHLRGLAAGKFLTVERQEIDRVDVEPSRVTSEMMRRTKGNISRGHSISRNGCIWSSGTPSIWNTPPYSSSSRNNGALSARLFDVTLNFEMTSYWLSGARLRASSDTATWMSGCTSLPVRPFCATAFSNDRSRMYCASTCIFICAACGAAPLPFSAI
jgi:hypothetical protein